MMPALIWRIFDEEKFLVGQPAGLCGVQTKSAVSLIPHLW